MTALASTRSASSLRGVTGAEPARTPGPDVERLVVVCGVGRSGTSLLQSMLNAHPDVAFPPETHFFRRYVAPRRTRARLERSSCSELARAFAADSELLRAGVAPDEMLAGERDGAIDLAAVFARFLGAYAARAGKLRVGDKDPRNLDHLAALHAAFPRALVLHVVRDPREVLLSRTRADWSKGRPWWAHVLLAEEQLRRGRRIGRELFGVRYLEVRYEELVTRLAETLAEVARHIDVAYDEAMLDFGASAATLVGESERAWKKETLGPLLQGNTAKWRAELSPAQVAFTERVSAEAFERLGYVREPASVPRRVHRAALALAPAARLAARAAVALRGFAEGRR